MNAVSLLRNRMGAARVNVHGLASAAAELDWVDPVLPGTSPLGLTLWHIPRTVDWLISTTIRGVSEVVDQPRFADLPAAGEFGFGTALSAEQARAAASEVRAESLAPYTDAVFDMADEWLASLSDAELDAPVPEFRSRQATRAVYDRPEAWAEIQHLVELPVGVLLLRPAMTHVFAHCGEVELLTQQGRARAGAAR